jgi:hypothetical protein
LANPNAVFYNSVNGTSNGAVRANGALHFNFTSTHNARGVGSLRLFNQAELRCGQANTHTQARTAQEGASI